MLTCQHCQLAFSEEPEGPAIIGRSDAEKLGELLGRLREHIRLQHPEQSTMCALLADRMLGLAVLANFVMPDGPIALWWIRAAAAVHQLVGRQLSDNTIALAVAKTQLALEGRPEQRRRARQGVEELLKQMRDWLNYADVREAAAATVVESDESYEASKALLDARAREIRA